METVLDVAQSLFHAWGYDGVGVAALTQAMGISSPSFYGAFRSKAALFRIVCERYTINTLRVDDVLKAESIPAEAVAALLVKCAHDFAADQERLGCLLMEAVRSGQAHEGGRAAASSALRLRTEIRDFVSRSHPGSAERIADFTVAVMSGLSASARAGMGEERVVAVAETASLCVRNLIAPR